MAEYIDRAAAVKVILRERKPTNSVAQNRMLSIIQRDLLTMCAADVAPVVHGRWNVVEGRRLDNAICSNCGRRFQAYYEAYRFCPNCGAKMDRGEDR